MSRHHILTCFLISEPTHKCGNILDLLLTDSPLLVANQKIHSPGAFIKSDYSPISFTLSSLIARRKAITRKIFNFKKANWKTLNNDLKRLTGIIYFPLKRPTQDGNFSRINF